MAKTKQSQVSLKHQSCNLTLNSSIKSISISLPSVGKTVHFLLEESQINCEEMAVNFVGKQKIASLHATYFNDPSPTDCITFPCDEPNARPCHLLGELFICPQVAKEFVKKNGGDLMEEITLYLVHGFLHLLGYDDRTEKQQKEMRKQEKKWMRALTDNHLMIKIQK